MTPQSGDGAYGGHVRHVYVHVPFCRAKCDYCDFASVAVEGRESSEVAALFDEYVAGVAAEWERERATHGVRRLHTLYLGGGTPSLLGPGRLERLLGLFRPVLTGGAEVTVEANPEDVDAAFAAWAGGGARGGLPNRRAPVRVSLGVQSFDPRARAGLGRRAGADPAAAVLRLRAAGVENLSIDLMYGLPGQRASELEAEIAALLALRPEHVSWYELHVVPGTPLALRAGAGAQTGTASPEASALLPGADLRAAMQRRIVRALEGAGYDWYEVSNYAVPGRRARHNVAYWRARPYLGLGPGAVSTVGARRWTNVADVRAWRASLAAGAPPPRTVEDLDAATRARERLMLAARCGVPVPLAALRGAVDEAAAAVLADAGLVTLRDGTIRVTRKGRHVADEVCVRLFRDCV